MLLTIGILKDFLHHIGLFAKREREQSLPQRKGYIQARLAAIICQSPKYHFVASLFFRHTLYIIVGFREIVLINQTHGVIAITTWHNLIRQLFFGLQGLQCLFYAGSIGVERLGRWIIVQTGIGTQIAGALQMGLQLVDGNTQLGIIHQSRLLVEIQVELLDIIFDFRQTATKQLSPTHYFHTPSTGPNKSQKRLWHQCRSLTDGYRFIVAHQIIDFEQHHSRIRLADALMVAILQFRGKAHARQLVGIVVGTVNTAIILPFELSV